MKLREESLESLIIFIETTAKAAGADVRRDAGLKMASIHQHEQFVLTRQGVQMHFFFNFEITFLNNFFVYETRLYCVTSAH